MTRIIEMAETVNAAGLVILATMQLVRWGMSEYQEHYGGRS